MKILVTGGGGFIGSHIAQLYSQSGHDVLIVDKKPKKELLFPLNKIEYLEFDLNKIGLERIFKDFKPEVVNHHAALIKVIESLKKPVDFEETNVFLTLRLLKLSVEFKIKKFIFASSAAIYGSKNKNNQDFKFPISEDQEANPDSFYGAEKFLSEKYISLFKPNFSFQIFRYANVFGPRQDASAEGGVVAIFAKSLIKNQRAMIFGQGNQTRDFIFVEDVAKANLLCLNKRESSYCNISSNQEISVIELFNKMKQIADSSSVYKLYPKRKGEIEKSVLENLKAKQTINWQPQYPLEKGLQITLKYFKKNHE